MAITIITTSGHLDLHDARPATDLRVAVNGQRPAELDGAIRVIDEVTKRIEQRVRLTSSPDVDQVDQWGNPLRYVITAKELSVYVPAAWLVDADAEIIRLERQLGHYQRIVHTVAEAIEEARR